MKTLCLWPTSQLPTKFILPISLKPDNELKLPAKEMSHLKFGLSPLLTVACLQMKSSNILIHFKCSPIMLKYFFQRRVTFENKNGKTFKKISKHNTVNFIKSFNQNYKHGIIKPLSQNPQINDDGRKFFWIWKQILPFFCFLSFKSKMLLNS